MICGSLRDCVVFEVKNSDFVVAAHYIPPSNSMYFDDIYMENIKLLYEKYKNKNFLLLGDLNARVGDVSYNDPTLLHCTNPDSFINNNGRQLIKWIKENEDMTLLNGLISKDSIFDSNFTFYRGRAKSQNDLAFSNESRSISSFKILEKHIQSDHCPICIDCTIDIEAPLEFIHDCAYHTFSNNQYDINRRLKQPIKFDKLNLNETVQKLKSPFYLGNGNNNLSSIKLSNHIYECCTNSYKQSEEHIEISGNLLNCKSSNFLAIAEANLHMYNILSRQEDPAANTYLEKWMKFEELARKTKNNEMNVKINKTWRDKKYDSTKLWKTIDWKGNAETKIEKPAHEADTMKYFTGIFQSNKTKDHAIVSDITGEIAKYVNYVPQLDDPITMEEVDQSLIEIGKGVSLDGIPPKIAKFLPQNIREAILELLNRVFDEEYPNEWSKNILHSIKKDGHTPRDPKLRGIAIGPFLSRIYDITIDRRFCSWYTPNKEQAAGKKEQGCPLQIFMLLLVVDYSCEHGKQLYIGFLDYEKAFDYANRAGILSDLVGKGCGSKFTKAISKMFMTSTYYPKSNKNYLSDGITTDYGVTQGRRSSGSLFSFYVSDMPDALNNTEYNDFMDPLSLAQLADDSAIYAEFIHNLIEKFRRIFEYSDDKNQVANIKKTVYCNFAKNPRLTPLKINETVTLESVNPSAGYKYIGFHVFPTNDVSDMVQRNVNKSMFHFAKFHAWLAVNELTPVDVKLMVYDSCALGAVLSASECWGDIAHIENQLREKELTALRAILNVKKGTTIDLIFHELQRCSVISKILDRQYSFHQKLTRISSDDAIVKLMIDKFGSDSTRLSYYKNVRDKNGCREMEERAERIRNSQSSMCQTYCNFDCMSNSEIYNSMLSEYYRIPISRWRLSNHRLQIEVGRYTKPKTPRPNRVCTMCNVVEDEEHVLYTCPRYQEVRKKYTHLAELNDVKRFLNPSYADMKDTANFIRDIESRRVELKLQ